MTEFKPGDEVYGTCDGSFAPYARAQAGRLAPKPANLSFAQAAAVPVSALTALHAVRDQSRVQPGRKVLIVGASGGVGTFAVQIAKAFCAEVTGVCSTAKTDLVRARSARPRPPSGTSKRPRPRQGRHHHLTDWPAAPASDSRALVTTGASHVAVYN